MRGRIKRFIEDKGYGFITGEDGQDYFFHISQVRDMVEIKNYMIVNFDIADGKKGKNAVNIRVSEQNNSPSKFITCGNTNIRLNNIKQYGLGQYAILYEKVFREDMKEKRYKFEDEWQYCGEISIEYLDLYISDVETSVLVRKSDTEEPTYNSLLRKKRREVFEIKRKKYLYITTYQNDNFTFKETEVDFDIYEKYNEICNAMK